MTSIKHLATYLLLIASSGALAAPPTFSLPYEQWRMISLPASPPAAVNTVEAILGDNMTAGGVYGENWVVYAYDTSTNGYGSALSLTDTMEKGKGYWIIQNFSQEAVTLDMPANSTETPATESIPLAASKDGSNQWNLAGNPFATSLALGDLRLTTTAPSCSDGSCSLDKDNDLIHNKVWIYDGAGYVEKGTNDQLDAWTGFWIAALGGSKDYPLTLGAKGQAPIIPSDKRITWTPGIPGGIPDTSSWNIVKVVGADPTGATNSIDVIQKLINKVPDNTVIELPEGAYWLEGTLELKRSNIVLRGMGATKTKINCHNPTVNQSVNQSCINVVDYGYGAWQQLPDTSNYEKGATTITVRDSSKFTVGEFAQLRQKNDSTVMQSDLGDYLVGQLFEVKTIVGNKITFKTPLHISYQSGLTPEIRPTKLNRNIGLEDLYIELKTDTDSYTINFKNVAYSWVKNIVSYKTKKAHINLSQSLGCEVRGSKLSHSYNYGGSGHGYGVALGENTTDTLVENNYFDHLRHSMLFQGGANGNVIAYNYSQRAHAEASTNVGIHAYVHSDISSHGGYAYMNLIEGNSAQNSKISDAHGTSGPGNTYLRNRIESKQTLNGFSYCEEFLRTNIDCKSIDHNVIGNSMVNILGNSANNIEHGNEINGEVVWNQDIDSRTIPKSYYLTSAPSFFGTKAWPLYGPDIGYEKSLPAQDAYSPTIESNKDELISITGPKSVSRGQSITLKAKYFAKDNRKLHIILMDEDWGSYGCQNDTAIPVKANSNGTEECIISVPNGLQGIHGYRVYLTNPDVGADYTTNYRQYLDVNNAENKNFEVIKFVSERK